MKKILPVLFLIALVSKASAQANPIDWQIARERQEAEDSRAHNYAIAIVAAGAFVGIGIFFGLRGRKGSLKKNA